MKEVYERMRVLGHRMWYERVKRIGEKLIGKVLKEDK